MVQSAECVQFRIILIFIDELWQEMESAQLAQNSTKHHAIGRDWDSRV